MKTKEEELNNEKEKRKEILEKLEREENRKTEVLKLWGDSVKEVSQVRKQFFAEKKKNAMLMKDPRTDVENVELSQSESSQSDDDDSEPPPLMVQKRSKFSGRRIFRPIKYGEESEDDPPKKRTKKNL